MTYLEMGGTKGRDFVRAGGRIGIDKGLRD